MSRNNVLKKIVTGVMTVLSFCLLAGCGDSASGEGLAFSKDEKGIIVELKTDKDNYQKGEELHYTLSVTNNKKGYTVSRVFVKSDNSEEFIEKETPEIKGMLKMGDTSSYEGTVVAFTDEEPTETDNAHSAIQGDVSKVTVRPYLRVNYGGEELTLRYIVEVIMFEDKVEIDAADKRKVQTVSCHDPSIVVATDKEGKKCYYIFGSHLAWAYSYDLENWTEFKNNINTDYQNIFAEPKKWSAHGSKNYPLTGFMWAPDVIYNQAMGKWCMYMSIDGDNWYSSIVMLTADDIWGDWSYEGIVVYSGFRTDEFYDETDVKEVTGEATLPKRYQDKAWGNFYPNNIDACVFYDDDGNLWMSYGSWSGGIFMLALDEGTGFRDLNVKYEDSIHSDPYFGKKIAGGQYVSGEASYIQKIGDYYWLFMSYGALEAKGGYNIRVYRSKTPDGDYVDELGNTPFFDTYVLNFNMPVGVRLFGGYKWKTFSVGQVAGGHNSAMVDDDGRAYIVFHTRTTNGSEMHYVKTHQLFLNQEGWLVAAPYQTTGEKLDASLTADEVSGEYEFLVHELNIDYAKLEVNKSCNISLNADGSISGDYSGSYDFDDKTGYINLKIDGETYSGVALKMLIENTNIETVVFTCLGKNNQISVWGSKAVQ